MRILCSVLLIVACQLSSLALNARASDPYCGLYCAHAALHSIGLECELDNLIIAENLSGDYGSTAEDLVRVIDDHGAVGLVKPSMFLESLRTSEMPVILHLASATNSQFHHWGLFLGMDGNRVRLYDPSKGVEVVSAAELLSSWDGYGIVVGKSSLPPARLQINLDVALAFMVAIVSLAFTYKAAAFGHFQAFGILVSAVLAGIFWHASVEYGFLRERLGKDILASKYLQFDLPVINYERLQELSTLEDGVTIIDARLPQDYRGEHIPGSVNLPVACTMGDIRETLTGIPENRTIVVYCQSRDCTWSDSIANQIAARGFSAVCIYRGGMEEWIERSATSTISVVESNDKATLRISQNMGGVKQLP